MTVKRTFISVKVQFLFMYSSNVSYLWNPYLISAHTYIHTGRKKRAVRVYRLYRVVSTKLRPNTINRRRFNPRAYDLRERPIINITARLDINPAYARKTITRFMKRQTCSLGISPFSSISFTPAILCSRSEFSPLLVALEKRLLGCKVR